jgi:lipopolysaccharide export system protein LptA
VFEYSVSSNEIQRITVEGSPVNYSQTLSNDGSSVTGTSTSLALYSDAAAQSIIELKGNASLNSPDSAMNCAAIVYLVDLDLIREATGPCSGSLDNTANN